MKQSATTAKLYCRIGEVAKLTGLKPSVIRFWELEFPEIAPQKSTTGQRLYSQQNIETILCIKELLYKEKLTIAGARNRLSKGEIAVLQEDNKVQFAAYIASELHEIKKLLYV